MPEYYIVSIPMEQAKAIQVIADARFGGDFQQCLEQAVLNSIIFGLSRLKGSTLRPLRPGSVLTGHWCLLKPA